MNLRVVSSGPLAAGSQAHIRLSYRSDTPMQPGARLWLFYDIRQDAGWVQSENDRGENFISVSPSDGEKMAVMTYGVVSRTLDLYPQVPEFLVLTEMVVGAGGLPAGQTMDISIERWRVPLRPINPFRFWLVVDGEARWDFAPTGYKSYRVFVHRGTGARVASEIVAPHLMDAPIEVTGVYPAVPAADRCKRPGLFWGELHGMAFNQRPLDDFYNYAKQVADLDFCAAMLFSYNTCVGNVWQQVKEAAKGHTVPGKFVAFVGFECGTPPDDSHRCAYFPEPEEVPPIFCDSRPPAQDPLLHARFHPNTVFCSTLDEFYATVRRYGGFVGGHFHTTTYDREVLAEMWQKQTFNVDEEARIFEYMLQGKGFALVGGSDTHDSMPGNPDPEPSCPRPAGITGVWADALTTKALADAFLARRVFATSGARMVLKFDSNGHSMGSELPLSAPRVFRVSVDGTADLTSVELLRDGRPVETWNPGGRILEAEFEDEVAHRGASSFYLIRVHQTDGHMGWSSPIWFGDTYGGLRNDVAGTGTYGVEARDP